MRRILTFLEDAWGLHGERVDWLIKSSFVDRLPGPWALGGELRQHLGPKLSQVLDQDADTRSFIHSLVERHPVLEPVLHDHLDDMDGLLWSYLFFGDLTRWLVQRFLTAGTPPIRDILDDLDEALAIGSEDVQNLIGVGFVEALPYPDEPGSEIANTLGPSLTTELNKQRPSYPSHHSP